MYNEVYWVCRHTFSCTDAQRASRLRAERPGGGPPLAPLPLAEFARPVAFGAGSTFGRRPPVAVPAHQKPRGYTTLAGVVGASKENRPRP